MAEWLKAAVSKTVMGHWPIESSNLSLSATPEATKPDAWPLRFLDDEAWDCGSGARRRGRTGLRERDTEGSHRTLCDSVGLAITIAVTFALALALTLTQPDRGGVAAREQDRELLVRSPWMGLPQL